MAKNRKLLSLIDETSLLILLTLSVFDNKQLTVTRISSILETTFFQSFHHSAIRKRIDEFAKHNLVKKRKEDQGTSYSITAKGKKIEKNLEELIQKINEETAQRVRKWREALEETRKRFEDLRGYQD